MAVAILTAGNSSRRRAGPDFRLRDLDLPCNEVAAGGDVSCFLSQRGHVLACGDRDALMTAQDVRTPVDVGMLVGTAAHVVHGGRMGAVLSRLGKLYTWGRNVDGALGIGEAVDA